MHFENVALRDNCFYARRINSINTQMFLCMYVWCVWQFGRKKKKFRGAPTTTPSAVATESDAAVVTAAAENVKDADEKADGEDDDDDDDEEEDVSKYKLDDSDDEVWRLQHCHFVVLLLGVVVA